ncbi:MAG: hypothetical protein ACLFVY_06075 [Phycisphaerae bacterium]
MRAHRGWMLCAVLPVLLAGCGAPTATLDLISVARRGLADARSAELQRSEEMTRRVESQMDALGEAFDTDVRLVSAGEVTGADGKPVALSPEWVISARKGYAAAQRMLVQQTLTDQADHLQRLDNLAAADEALQMATGLIVRRAAVSQRVRNVLMDLHGRMIDEE